MSILFYIDGEIGFPSTPLRFTDTYVKMVKDSLDRFYKDEFIYPLTLNNGSFEHIISEYVSTHARTLGERYLAELRINLIGDIYILRSTFNESKKESLCTTEFLPTGNNVRYVISAEGSERDVAAGLLANFTTKEKLEKHMDKFLLLNNSKYSWLKVDDICNKIAIKNKNDKEFMDRIIKKFDDYKSAL